MTKLLIKFDYALIILLIILLLFII